MVCIPKDAINYISRHGWVTYSLVEECRRFLESEKRDYYKFFQRLEENWNFLPVIISGDPYKTAMETIELIIGNIRFSTLESNIQFNDEWLRRDELYQELRQLMNTKREK